MIEKIDLKFINSLYNIIEKVNNTIDNDNINIT